MILRQPLIHALIGDGKKFTFAGIPLKGGGCDIWEMNVDGSGVRQMTDYKGTCRAPIYYAAGSIEEERVVSYGEPGTLKATGRSMARSRRPDSSSFAGSADGVMDDSQSLCVQSFQVRYAGWSCDGENYRSRPVRY